MFRPYMWAIFRLCFDLQRAIQDVWNLVYYTYRRTQLYFTQQYSMNTTTCLGHICGPSSGCALTYRAAIQDVWNLVYYTYSRAQIYFTQQYSRNTTTCFGPICGPSSGCALTYRAAIQGMWGIL